MPRILVAECKQEVSTFNPNPSGYDDFMVRTGADFFAYHRGVRYEVGGALSVFDSAGTVEAIPAYSALLITSGGTLSAPAWKRIATEFLEAVRTAPPVDGVYFAMHGAMASTLELDPEGYLLTETRRILGEDVPIVVSLDLHGILTERMLRESDAIASYHTYPHVDFYETGQRAARLLLRILERGAKPVTAMVSLPALVRGDELITETGRIRHSIQAAQAVERRPDGLSAGIFIGNPFTDVPELATCAFASADGDSAAAADDATEIAEQFWRHHQSMRVPLVSLEETARIVLANRTGTVGLVDAADATSSGASGDSNVIVGLLHQAGYLGRVLAPIVDAAAVRDAFRAGVGAIVSTAIGGTLDPGRFSPLPVKAKVRLLSDGRFRSESFGGEWYSGPTAVLEWENITVVATSRAVSLYDRSLFLAHGQEPRCFDAVVIKSPHCQPHMYQDWCARMVNVDAPGSTSANLPSLGHTRCRRPIFPLDPDVRFNPEVRLFQRPRYRS